MFGRGTPYPFAKHMGKNLVFGMLGGRCRGQGEERWAYRFVWARGNDFSIKTTHPLMGESPE